MKEYAITEDKDFRRWGMTAMYLAGCALHGICPDIPEETNLDSLLAFCKFHSISSIVSMSLERYWKEAAPADGEQMKQWKLTKDMAIRKNILLNAERERITQYLESISCWYMPLKGSLLQFDYPKFGMRQMGDNDLLVDYGKRDLIHDFMCRNQYTAPFYGQGNHDEYLKRPVYNFEMHWTLFEKTLDPVLAAYYGDAKHLMRKDESNCFGYHMSDEDFYIYLVAHAYKHMTVSGIGVRHLLDVYVYLRKHGESMDMDYVCRELRKFGAEDFALRCESLARTLLDHPGQEITLSDEDQRMLDAFFQSGTYGTEKQLVDKSLANLSGDGKKSGFLLKLRYVFSRLFPSLERMAVMYPELRERKWLLPIVYIKRLLKGFSSKRGSAVREMHTLFDSKDENA